MKKNYKFKVYKPMTTDLNPVKIKQKNLIPTSKSIKSNSTFKPIKFKSYTMDDIRNRNKNDSYNKINAKRSMKKTPRYEQKTEFRSDFEENEKSKDQIEEPVTMYCSECEGFVETCTKNGILQCSVCGCSDTLYQENPGETCEDDEEEFEEEPYVQPESSYTSSHYTPSYTHSTYIQKGTNFIIINIVILSIVLTVNLFDICLFGLGIYTILFLLSFCFLTFTFLSILKIFKALYKKEKLTNYEKLSVIIFCLSIIGGIITLYFLLQSTIGIITIFIDFIFIAMTFPYIRKCINKIKKSEK